MISRTDATNYLKRRFSCCKSLIALGLVIAFYAGIATLLSSPVINRRALSVGYHNNRIVPFNIVGRANDDPLLISYIRSQMHKPSTLPYNLSNPGMKDFSGFKLVQRVKELFHEKRGGFFVEVGAFDGESLSNTLYWEREYNWTGLLIEPNPNNFKLLMAKHRKAYALEGCLCPTRVAEMITFKGMGPHGKITSKDQHAMIKLPCYPLSSILLALQNPTVDFLSLDIEGWELAVLKTLPYESVDIHVMMVEYLNLKEGIEGLKKYVEEKGFDFIERMGNDLVFRKKGVNL